MDIRMTQSHFARNLQKSDFKISKSSPVQNSGVFKLGHSSGRFFKIMCNKNALANF